MCVRELDPCGVQTGFQILFRALLRMKAYAVVVRLLSSAKLTMRDGVVALCLFDPFPRQGIHTKLCPCP